MSEIDAPSSIPLKTGEGASRVTRTSTTSDDSSTQQQSPDQRAKTPEKQVDTKEKAASYETAVTLSSSLSSLEKGAHFTANYDGIDGQNRPLITAESGSFVIKYDPSYQQSIDKLPPNAVLDIKILKVDREIEARLHYTDPALKTNAPPSITIPVVLELVSLGNQPPKIPLEGTLPHSAQDQTRLNYQTSILQQAENIARESARKIQELPLPTNSTNYTLFERAVPHHNHPGVIETKIAGNALIAQEQAIKQPLIKESAAQTISGDIKHVAGQDQTPASPPLTPTATSSGQMASAIEKLLHKNILVTVVKNFPKETVALPEIVQKQLGLSFPLDNVKAGQTLTLQIESIAVPEQRPIQTAISSEKVAATQQASPPLSNTAQYESSKPPPQSPSAPVEANIGFSGIVIDPGRNVLQGSEKGTSALSGDLRQYQNRFAQTPYAPKETRQAERTLYVATPTSVIKFQSPVELAPGAVINFFSSDIMVTPTNIENMATPSANQENVKNTPSPASPAAVTTAPPQSQNEAAPKEGWTEITISEATGAVAPVNLPLQPLTEMMQDWQTLSQILSVTSSVSALPIGPALDNRLPTSHNPAQMTSSMVFFLAALGAKAPARTWLGPAITQQLEKGGHEKLIRSLDMDMQRIFRIGHEIPVNEWRPALVPLQVGGEVTAIPLLTRQILNEDQHKKNKSDDEADTPEITATRFIVELQLSRIGQIQIDGLLKEKKLNIIIRSKVNLPPQLKSDISEMYRTALEISGYEGDLHFRENSSPDISVQKFIDQKMHILQRNRIS